MKFLTVIIVLAVLAAAVFLLGTDIDIKDEGALPDVDVTAEGGRLPDADVNTPEVNINSNRADVAVPDVDVEMEEKEVEYPTIDFNAAEDSALDEAAESDAEERE